MFWLFWIGSIVFYYFIVKLAMHLDDDWIPASSKELTLVIILGIIPFVNLLAIAIVIIIIVLAFIVTVLPKTDAKNLAKKIFRIKED